MDVYIDSFLLGIVPVVELLGRRVGMVSSSRDAGAVEQKHISARPALGSGADGHLACLPWFLGCAHGGGGPPLVQGRKLSGSQVEMQVENLSQQVCALALGMMGVPGLLGASQVALVVKNPSASAEDIKDMGLIPGLRMIPWRRAWQPMPWRIPWTEEPGGLQSMGSQSQIGLKQLSTHTYLFRMQPGLAFSHRPSLVASTQPCDGEWSLAQVAAVETEAQARVPLVAELVR